MKKPNLKNIKVNNILTKQIRNSFSKQKSVKITINIDSETLANIRSIADKSGIPYQRLINKTLKEQISSKVKISDDRLDRLEHEIKSIKKKLAA